MSQIKTKFIENAAVTDAKVATGIDAAKIADGSVSNAEFQFINSLSSNAQTQLNGKQSTTLTDAHILVGNGSNIATDVAVSGDLTLANTGAYTIANNAISTAKIAADAVTGAKIRLANNEVLRARNAANSADIAILQVDTNDEVNVLDGAAALPAMNASDRTLLDSAGTPALAWEDTSRSLFDEAGNPAMHFASSNRELVDSANNAVLQFNTASVLSAIADLEVQPVSGSASEIHMYNDDGDFKSVVSADPTLAADSRFQLPPDNGTAGYFLQTDGAGITSWAAASGSSSTNEKETFVLSGTDITNQYIDLANVALNDSIHFAVKGAPSLLEGASYDYSVSYTGGAGGNTRITFLNDLATGGNAALIATDVVQVQYQF